MSKRPLFPNSTSARSTSCLDFLAWQLQQHQAQDDKNHDSKVYQPGTEDPPDELWYGVDLDLLGSNIRRMCSDLGQPVAHTTIVDHEISELRRTLTQSTSIPRPKKVIVAVVGNQGMGKSSTINALLNRNLVEVLGGSEACTAFATIIEYKEGAADDTTLSDIKVVFLSLDEIRDFIEEHIRRYATFVAQSGLDDEEEDLDAEDSDSAAQEAACEEKRTISKAVQQGADTAEEFFRIMFNADFDEVAEGELSRWLKEQDLEDGRFLERLMQLATDHMDQIQHQEAGSLVYTDVRDGSLEDVRSWAVKMWPLVKSVTIATGSVLLRQGICLMDLPGYGDLNQTRTAVVNQFRRQANFEIIVTTSDRYLTKKDEDRYLARAVQQDGADSVFLVLNKLDSQSLLAPSEMKLRLKKKEYKSEPFLSIDKNLASIARFPGRSDIAAKYQQYLLREAQMAFCQYERDKIAGKLQQGGIQVFAVTAGQYRQWIDPERLQMPSYKPEETGIPRLRRALLTVPAAANYDDLSAHVFETFSDIEDKVSRILEKFTDDDMVSEIRRHLLNLLPALGRGMKEIASTLPEEIVPLAWDSFERSSIADGMAATIRANQRNTYYQTWSLMLRNNGEANGSDKYSHKSLNRDLLEVYVPQMKDWKNKTMAQAKQLCSALDQLVQDPLKDMQRIMDEATEGDRSLKVRANEELYKLNRRIEVARGRLQARLEGAVNENHRHFTTEDDIKCPIAVKLKDAYIEIHNIRIGEGRRPGIYAQQRSELIRTVTKSKGGRTALVDAIPAQVKSRQCEKWHAVSEDFIADILARFKDFARIMQDLLESETYMSDEHRVIRKRLSKQLPGFRNSLKQVTAMFPAAETQRAAKRARRLVSASPSSARFTGFGRSQIKRE